MTAKLEVSQNNFIMEKYLCEKIAQTLRTFNTKPLKGKGQSEYPAVKKKKINNTIYCAKMSEGQSESKGPGRLNLKEIHLFGRFKNIRTEVFPNEDLISESWKTGLLIVIIIN